jgi:dTDP-4-dehydrorhamnose 3,5-epimerase
LVNGEFYELDGKSNKMVYIPEGFAHGFSFRRQHFSYKCTAGYNKESEEV